MAILIATPSGSVGNIADLDVSRISEGTLIAELVSGESFQLVASNAAIDHVNVESVKDQATLRWIRYREYNAGSVIYVSPDGDDDNNGSERAPKEHIYNGLVALMALGGGTLFCADGCDVGGPVEGQGIWLRRDQTIVCDIPGFLNVDVPITIRGTGNSVGIGAFAPAPVSSFSGGGGRFKPPLWILGQGQMPPVTVNRMQQPQAAYTGAIIGCDWDRNVDGSLRHLTIDNATRTGSSTVLTLDMSTVPELTVSSASRTGNVTTLTIPNPGIPYQPWRVGQHILVTSTDPNFSSGDYVVTGHNNGGNEGDNSLWTLTYNETDSDQAETPTPGIVVQSHNCHTDEMLDLVSNTENFLSISYYVTGATADTVTILDDQANGGDQDIDDIGTLVHQERLYGHTNMVKCEKVTFNMRNAVEPPHFFTYPSWNLGSNLAYPLRLTDCWVQGNTMVATPSATPVDRMCAALFAYGTGSGTAVVMRDCNGAANKIYVKARGGITRVDIRDCLIEAPSFSWEDPGIKVDGNGFTSVYVSDFTHADTGISSPWVEINGCHYSGVNIYRSGPVTGTVVGGDIWQTPNNWTTGTNLKNPWVGFNGSGMQIQSWADGRITGKHPGAPRAMGPVMARYQNVVNAADDWIPNVNGTVTPGGGVAAPDGMPSDLIETSGGVANITITNDSTFGLGVETGGRFIVCGWINSNTSLRDGLFVLSSNQFTAPGMGPGYAGTGWQFVSGSCVLENVDPGAGFFAYLTLPDNATVSVYGLTVIYVPADVDANDYAEYAGTVRHQARYLAPSVTGTMDGQRFVGHGGVGIDSAITKTVGAGSGQLTLTGSGTVYEPRYDDDGTTIIGWVALLQATVNP